MWGPRQLIVFSLATQTTLGQIEHRVLGIRNMKTDGGVFFYPSEGAAPGFDYSLQTANAGNSVENAWGSLAIRQGEDDFGVQEFDDGRVLFSKWCWIIIYLYKLLKFAGCLIEVFAEFTDSANGASERYTTTAKVGADGNVKAEFDRVSANFFSGNELCETCGITITAGNTLGECLAATESPILGQFLLVTSLKIFGDPHMTGMLGQTFDWSGQDKGWYSLVSDGEDFQLNVRLTAPMPVEFPDRQLVSAVSILSPGGRSFVIEVKNPYAVDTVGCGSGDGSSLPCLANGALRFIVDGVEHIGLQMPGQAVEIPGDRFVSSANLPAECRPFGGDRIWAAQYANMIEAQRSLRGYEEEFEEWILQEDNMAAPTWCAKFLQEEGLPGLNAVESNHAVFHVVTPTASLRINIGVNHQDRVTSEDGSTVLVPELDFWQGDVGVERSSFSGTVSGMLGETSRPVLDEHGLPIMEGIGAIRGTPEDYRVEGPFGVEFDILGH